MESYENSQYHNESSQPLCRKKKNAPPDGLKQVDTSLEEEPAGACQGRLQQLNTISASLGRLREGKQTRERNIGRFNHIDLTHF